jgi:serine/threonine protein kinase/Flp pilus assembly protein TadD
MRACTATTALSGEDRPGSEPLPGYRLVARVGSGGAGDVWQAEAPGGLRVALKIVRLGDGLGRREVANLSILRAIRHPNLLAYFGAWQSHDRLIIGMELADRSLWDRFLEARRLGLAGIPRAELLGILGDVARVVDFLNEPRHELDGRARVAIHHRDIKPQNIMLIGHGVKVADFGLSCLADTTGAGRSQCGLTCAYAAPESFRGKVSGASDQYSLAVTFCQLRTGRLPFVGPPAAVMMGHLFGEPDLSAVPESERPVIARALAKDAEDRWPDCRSFVVALSGCASAGSPDEMPADEGEPARQVPGSSLVVQPMSATWDGTSSVSAASPGFDGADEALSAYCLDFEAPEDRPSGEPSSLSTIVASRYVASAKGRRAARFLVAAAVLIGVVGWSFRARPVGSAAMSSSSRRLDAAESLPARRQGWSTTIPAACPATADATRSRAKPAVRRMVVPDWTPMYHRARSEARTWLASIRTAASRLAARGLASRSRQIPSPDQRRPHVQLKMPEVLEVEAGRDRSIPIRLDRPAQTDPLVLHFLGLPTGVSIPDVRIAAGAREASVNIRTRLDSADSSSRVSMVVQGGSLPAERAFQLRIRANPALLSRTRGHTLLALGRPAEAVAAFDQAVQAGVADPFVFNNRGMAHYALGQLEPAIRDYTEASRLSPSDPVIRYNRGVAYARRGDDVRALLDLDLAIRLKPDYARAYEARAGVYLKRGDRSRSSADSARASELSRAARAQAQPPVPRPPPSGAATARSAPAPGASFSSFTR